MAVSPSEIELALDELKRKPYSPASFFFGFLEAHDAPKATISKIRNSSDTTSVDLLWPRKLRYRHAEPGLVSETLQNLKASSAASKNSPRFLIVSDGTHISGYDNIADEHWHDDFINLNSHFNMTLPLAGLERFQSVDENPADIKAAGRLAKFYDAILEANPDWSGESYRHELNLFMTRVLFCMFAEDTHIAPEDIFTLTIEQNTKTDGSDVAQVLAKVFEVLDLKPSDRRELPSYVSDFPYVNGGLFREKTAVPTFSRRARSILIDACKLQWAEINPDIFGSMIQGVVDAEKRSELGMHYTSVPNIMKLIGPLFLDALKAEFEQAGDNVRKLERLLARLHRIRIFDPACGSGNFLIIAYREIRRLEMAIFKRLQSLAKQSLLPMSQVRLSQFYGVEYADFAAETAKLALWIAEYQANKEFKAEFGSSPPALPLRDAGRIQQGNALRVDWLEVCPPEGDAEVFIVGNPPYLGSTYQNEEQKDDMTFVFKKAIKSYKNLDYVAAWYLKAADYCTTTNAQAAFVATNSICQGEQVGMLWPCLLKKGVEIGFAHTAFKWKNNASRNAGVTCVIVGIRPVSKAPKLIFAGDIVKQASNISPYLIDMENIIVRKRSKPLVDLPLMEWGNKPTDGGHFILDKAERASLLKNYPSAGKFVRRYLGTKEFIDGISRWCVWVEDSDLEEAEAIPPLKAIFEKVKAFRAASKAAETRAFKHNGHRFRQIQDYGSDALIVTSTSSENRPYIPAGFLPGDCIISNLAYAAYGADPFLLAIVSSKMHLVWTKTVGGQLETRLRYTNTLVYNTFPVPELTDGQRAELSDCAWRIIEERESHPGKTIGELYDPKTMPPRLLEAHRSLDETLERFYRGRSFKNDEERLTHLFKLYAFMTKNNH